MIECCLQISLDKDRGLQEQLREVLVTSILAGRFIKDESLPSCRSLSEQLNISRNTVSLVYESLCADGYLISRPRSGYYIAPQYDPDYLSQDAPVEIDSDSLSAPNWDKLLKNSPSQFLTIHKPSNWMKFTYPFIYGQPDANLFPMEKWREAARKITSNMHPHDWVLDLIDQDDSALVTQLRNHVLPKRGIIAQPSEILITLGTQNALSLVSQLLFNEQTAIGVESPVYLEAVNTFKLQTQRIYPHAIDSQGMQLNERSKQCDYFYVTPSHQAPTGVSMSNARRQALLQHAISHDQIILEDDFDSDTNIEQRPRPALKANDQSGRVIYMSSLSKALSPGLRLGYIVAPAELVDELRALRRLNYRHPPTYIQYQLAYFLSQGYYESFLRHYRENSAYRWSILKNALDKYLPMCRYTQTKATAFWIEAPKEINCETLAWRAAHKSILIEPGRNYFLEEDAPSNFFRLGFHAIAPEAIEPGIASLAQVMHHLQQSPGN
ncbi:PLP-dependent aminotransferase family protein [Celerinatantimonas sp. MCCC 1A17872]|uniref:MocR-like pyridoxine biosynthesis transcription factor PdxR n=1 Tax=Celerinatantimonas sp. MCCC 1A17872 TaxID=3177514 RepID=UPI0038C48095